MKYLVLILSFLPLLCLAQSTITTPVDQWKCYPVPNKELAQVYNNADDEWTVFIRKGRVWATNKEQDDDPLPFIVKHDPKKDGFSGQRFVMKVDDGFLVAYNAGEWGGRLYWFSKDGSESYQISSHRVVKFIKRKDKIYAIEGLAHLSISEGSIVEVKKLEGKWVAEEFVKLPFAPEAVALDKDNNFIVAISQSLIKVTESAQVAVLISNGFWAYYLYPNSAVIQKDVLYIGMRKGIFRYNLTTGKQEWLMK